MALMTGMSETRQMAPTYSSAIADAHNYMSWIVGTMRPYFGRDVLEVGIGHGSYHEYLGKLGSYRGIGRGTPWLSLSGFGLLAGSWCSQRFHGSTLLLIVVLCLHYLCSIVILIESECLLYSACQLTALYMCRKVQKLLLGHVARVLQRHPIRQVLGFNKLSCHG